VALQLAMSFLNQINEYTNLQDLRGKFTGFTGFLLSEPRLARISGLTGLHTELHNPENPLIGSIMVQTFSISPFNNRRVLL